MKAEVGEIHANKKNLVAMKTGQPHVLLQVYVILMCYTSLFYLITIFLMTPIIAVPHLPHGVSHPKDMEEKKHRNRK